jgi:hypothetical protein
MHNQHGKGQNNRSIGAPMKVRLLSVPTIQYSLAQQELACCFFWYFRITAFSSVE